MIVKRFFEPLIAQNSYLIGCSQSGKAVVIDPHRDIEMYVRAAESEHLQIAFVTETHIHADYLSGSRELAAITGAQLLLSDEGDASWKYAFAREGSLIRGFDRFSIGRVTLEAVHTPGHTPEHLTFLVTDGAVADQPIAALTGDFIFVGDVGRPDLLERAANIQGTMEAGARTLYRSLQAFNTHEEWLQLWPGHGAGSSCGKGISAVPHSTLGYERRFNWAFKVASEDEFVEKVLAGQPDPPKYFATMKRMNKEGPPGRGEFAAPPKASADRLAQVLADGAVVIDARSASDYAANFVPGTINLPLNGSFVTWAGWLVPYDVDIYVVIPDGGETRLAEIVRAFALIGLDRVQGYFTADAIDAQVAERRATIPQIQPRELAGMRGDRVPVVLDVRNDTEWRDGHLPAAIHIPLGRLTEHLSELPQGQPVIVQCAAGARSSIAASVLTGRGVRDVSNLAGGYNAWVDAGLPTTR